MTVDQVKRYWAGSSSFDNYITGNIELKWLDVSIIYDAEFRAVSSSLDTTS